MATALKVTVTVEKDGKPLDGFPVVRRYSADEVQGFEYEEPNDGDAVTFSAIPTAQLATIKALVLRTDRQITLRVDGQTDAGLVLDADALLVVIGATIDAAAATNLMVNNNSGGTAVLEGMAGGT